jgi:hypothetical protein
MLYSEIIAVCSEIHTKHINTLSWQNVVEQLSVKPGGTYSYHWALKGHVTGLCLTRRHTTACGSVSVGRHPQSDGRTVQLLEDCMCRLSQCPYRLCSHSSDTSVDNCCWKHAKFWAYLSYWTACHTKCYKIKKPSLGAFQKINSLSFEMLPEWILTVGTGL